MGATTISWCDHSINPIRARHLETGRTGHYCEKLSQGCKNCYSSRLQARFGMPPFAASHKGDVEPFFDATRLDEVLHRKKPTRYFWCDMTDMFGDWVPDTWIDQCLTVMAMTPQHTHMLLTKRPERMYQYMTRDFLPGRCTGARMLDQITVTGIPGFGDIGVPLPNIWLGVSVEDQATADERIPWLLKTPAAVRFVSAEPLPDLACSAPARTPRV